MKLRTVGIVLAAVLLGSYVCIQGYYIFRAPHFIGAGVFMERSYERTVDWPLGETVVINAWPRSEMVVEKFPPYKTVIVDRFFYRIETKRHLDTSHGVFTEVFGLPTVFPFWLFFPASFLEHLQ